ncbi:MAG: serine/threonine-protein kinase [Ktedonobacteraceae bacterium]
MTTEPRRRLGKYELQERLGHGGMAEVWKAFDTQLRRHVAIKLLHANLQADPDFVTRFEREAQAVASLRHPNIVQIHDFQVSEPPESNSPTPYMVMAYIEGQTLAAYIANTSAQGKIPSPGEIVNLFTSISLAVDYAHAKGMIHRDIKPANILLDRHNTVRNPMGEPILTDFGLAKLLGVSAGTVTAAQLGTPVYTSPEQARGYAGNERSDLYALGVMLYEIVTGTRPFRGDTPLAILAQHLEAMPTSPVLLNPNIPPALTMVIMTALAKDPNARYARATTMTAAIAEALNVPLPDSLGQAAYPPDMRNMPTYISSSTLQMGGSITPSSSTPSFAISPSSSSMPPTSGVGLPTGAIAGSSSGTVLPVNSTPQVAPLPSPATPIFQQPYSFSASGATVAAGSPPGSSSPPASAIQSPLTPTIPGIPSPPIPPRGTGRRWKGLYTVVVVLVILALLGSGVGAYFVFFHSSHQNNQASVPVAGGQAFFLSSGQFDFSSALGVADELQIELHNIPAPQSGKSYYVWLLGDRHPQVEQNLLQPPPQFTLPLSLGKLPFSDGNITFLYQAPHNYNLISIVSRLLITEEDTNGTPRGPSANRSAWRYYAEIPQTPYGSPQLSALDHIRHLFYKETVVNVLGLPGGLDTWLFRNTEKVMEWAISARDDYHPQLTNSDFAVIHPLFVDMLDYLDGAPNVHLDTPDGITTDPTISRVALLSVTAAQVQGTELANNPPGYVDHVQLHVKGIVDAPDATPQMRTTGNQIIAALNNHVKPWLEQVRMYAQQLVKMDSLQLEQPSTLTMLDSLLSYATYAYIGQLDPNSNTVVPGVLQIHYLMQQLATLTITPQLPQTI